MIQKNVFVCKSRIDTIVWFSRHPAIAIYIPSSQRKKLSRNWVCLNDMIGNTQLSKKLSRSWGQ